MTFYPAIKPLKNVKKTKQLFLVENLIHQKDMMFLKCNIKILNRYEDWNALAIGNEPREKFNFNHQRLKIDWITHEEMLNFIKNHL